MSLVDDLKAAIVALEQGTEAEIAEAAQYLETLRAKISVRAMSLPLQRNAVMIASNVGDKPTLRRFENSQYEEIREWAKQAQLPRSGTLRIVM